MDKKEKKQNQGASMFIYTALIFTVALVLIIVAFFGQIKRPKSEEQLPTPTPVVEDIRDKKLVEELNGQIKTYETLVKAASYINLGEIESAEAEIGKIDSSKLTKSQTEFYNQIFTKINEGKVQ